MSKLGCAVALVGLVTTSASMGMAGDLQAASPPPVSSAPVSSAPASSAPGAAPAPAPHASSSPGDRRARREMSSLGGSDYVLGGVAADSGRGVGSFGRAELDLYASIGLGGVTFIVGGPVLLVEVAAFAGPPEICTPFLLTVGARANEWVVTGAVGPVIGSVMDDHDATILSPRVELRAGYREDNTIEIEGMVGYEHHMVFGDPSGEQWVLAEPPSERWMFGLSVGFGGDG